MVTLAVAFGEPYEQGHVELVDRRAWRGVEKEFALVVKDVFAMVGGVEQRGRGVVAPQLGDERVEEVVGIGYGVVIGVEQARAVGGGHFVGQVGGKPCHSARVTHVIVEV